MFVIDVFEFKKIVNYEHDANERVNEKMSVEKQKQNSNRNDFKDFAKESCRSPHVLGEKPQNQ